MDVFNQTNEKRLSVNLFVYSVWTNRITVYESNYTTGGKCKINLGKAGNLLGFKVRERSAFSNTTCANNLIFLKM
jgi:hypothetical protein